eukprot:scaffold194680_cov39-Prasinocladus_malaysianus.AAC.1
MVMSVCVFVRVCVHRLTAPHTMKKGPLNSNPDPDDTTHTLDRSQIPLPGWLRPPRLRSVGCARACSPGLTGRPAPPRAGPAASTPAAASPAPRGCRCRPRTPPGCHTTPGGQAV